MKGTFKGSLKQAFERQEKIWQEYEQKKIISENAVRSHSLREGYEFRQEPSIGYGMFSINTKTGEYCRFKGVWNENGTVLLCVNCFEDGS